MAIDVSSLVGSSAMTGTAAKKNPSAVFAGTPNAGIPGEQGGMEVAYRPSQGPIGGGPEQPGTPNTSPSTLSTAQNGLIKAVQDLSGPEPGWAHIPAPGGQAQQLGQRLDPVEPAQRTLGRLVRGVY